MNGLRRALLGFVLIFGAALGAREPLHAQEAITASNAPALKCPVDSFRDLLAMTQEERKKAIADRSPNDQRLILAKIREYEALKPDQRELKLRMTELRWYLLPLLNLSPRDRAAHLVFIPADIRKLVEDRLQQWDLLKPEAQKELSVNEQAMQLLLRPEERSNMLANISPARRLRLNADVERIRAMPEAQRRELTDHFKKFFELTEPEQDKALRSLSPAERQQMEKTLALFRRMPSEQRIQCVESFTNFASMSLPERQQFLKNADRWRRMTPNERQTWRELVAKVPDWPPLPPDFPAPPQAPGQ